MRRRSAILASIRLAATLRVRAGCTVDGRRLISLSHAPLVRRRVRLLSMCLLCVALSLGACACGSNKPDSNDADSKEARLLKDAVDCATVWNSSDQVIGTFNQGYRRAAV